MNPESIREEREGIMRLKRKEEIDETRQKFQEVKATKVINDEGVIFLFERHGLIVKDRIAPMDEDFGYWFSKSADGRLQHIFAKYESEPDPELPYRWICLLGDEEFEFY